MAFLHEISNNPFAKRALAQVDVPKTVFNQNLFGEFLEQKNYLNASYTRYKNQLYVSLSSLNDADFACTEEEKRLSHDFYKMKR